MARKKSVKKKNKKVLNKSSSKVNFKWGLKGLEISLIFLIIIQIILVIYLLQQKSLQELFKMMIVMPQSSLDWLAIFGGAIIFIAIPFLIGIHFGLNLSKSKKNKP